MEIEQVRKLTKELRDRTNESWYFCMKALCINEYNIDRAEEWFKSYYFDSHCFIRERNK